MIRAEIKGDFRKTKKFLTSLLSKDKYSGIERIAKEGVKALEAATPVDTGLTAASWIYEIEQSEKKTVIYFSNLNVNNGVNVAVILQYGHGTRNGGFVQGRDYINPAIKPIFDKMEEDMWKVVVSK